MMTSGVERILMNSRNVDMKMNNSVEIRKKTIGLVDRRVKTKKGRRCFEKTEAKQETGKWPKKSLKCSSQ